MSQKINTPSFRTSIRGYNKDDINKYIKDLNGNFVFATRDYEDKIRSLKAAVSDKDQIIAKLQKELSDCRNELSKAAVVKPEMSSEHDMGKSEENVKASKSEALISALRERCEDMLGRLRTLGDEKMKAEVRASEAQTRIRQLEAKLMSDSEIQKPSECDDLVHKAEMYDRISGQIGRIMIDARENSDIIISDAKNQAKKIHEESEEVLRLADAEANRIKAEAENELRRCRKNAEEYLRSLSGTFASVSAGVAKQVGTKYGELVSLICVQLHDAAEKAARQSDELAEVLMKDCSSELETAVKKAIVEMADTLDYNNAGESKVDDMRGRCDTQSEVLKDISLDFGAAD